MPRKKQEGGATATENAKPDTRSKRRKAIDRARSYIDRMRLLSRNGAANLEDAVEVCQDGGADLDHDEFTAFNGLIAEAGKLLLHLPTTVRMVEMIGESQLGKSAGSQDVLKMT